MCPAMADGCCGWLSHWWRFTALFGGWMFVGWLKKILSVRDCEMLYAVVKKENI